MTTPLWVPPGHFYSPMPDLNDIKDRSDAIFDVDKPITDIDLNEEEQMAYLEKIASLYPSTPFGPKKEEGLRYYYDNPAYSYSDAIVLCAMIRTIRPNRIVEVGSGYSSCVILDTNEHFMSGNIASLFIEPYPQLLYSLVGEKEKERLDVIAKPLQEVDLSVFQGLGDNDILFIDSTHVCKTGSDVNYIFFDVLPQLKEGVWIHFHDIFYPFEYPTSWVYEGRAWNEIYLLRAFLQNNEHYKIRYFQHMMVLRHRRIFEERMPLCLKNSGGNIWIRKETQPWTQP